MARLNHWLASKSVWKRFLGLTMLYLTVFLGTIILSHFFLPEGFLRRYSEGRGGTAVSDFRTVFLQIFAFNLISVVLIAFASLFAQRKAESQVFRPASLNVLLVLATLNGVILGTHSFAIQTANTGLLEKTVGLLDLSRYAALWEIAALLLFAAVMYDKNLVLRTGKNAQTRQLRQPHWSRSEIVATILAVVFLIIGALVEAKRVVDFFS